MLPTFERQIRQAQQHLARFLECCTAPYVSFSGGKDSLCLLILLSHMGSTDIPVFTQADDLDWPEKRTFCEQTVSRLGFADYTYARSDISAVAQFAQLSLGGSEQIRGTFSHVIRRYVRERARDGVLMGLRSEESVKRRMTRAIHGACYRTKAGMWHGLPIANWSGRDVFALICSTGTPYLPLYDCDDEKPPHELRMSWMLNPAFIAQGAGAFLKRYYPEQFTRLCLINPNLRASV